MPGNPEFMRQAIALATENVTSGRGGPFGALVVRDGVVIAVGANEVTTTNDPTAHAEVVAIRRAGAALKKFRLAGCEIYTSCEPCPMCLAAIYWARIGRIWYGNDRKDAAAIGFDDDLLYQEIARPLSQRAIPTERLLPEEARAAFVAWAQKEDKVPY